MEKGEGEGEVTSCLWPERMEELMDMTDYRQGQSSRPTTRPQLSLMEAGRGMWGTKRGHKQERYVLVKEREKRKKERKKILFQNILL